MDRHWMDVLDRMKAGFRADMASPTGVSPIFVAAQIAKTAKRREASKKVAEARQARGERLGRPDYIRKGGRK